nr:aconitase family protein [Actinomycetota bacterium]
MTTPTAPPAEHRDPASDHARGRANAGPQTLVEKLWEQHRIDAFDAQTDLMSIDRVILHERSGALALRALSDDGRTVANPEQVYATVDHVLDTTPGRTDSTRIPGGQEFIQVFREEARARKITLFDVGDEEQGISHVVSAEQGLALPGTTLVCADSHTGTLGGLGALAWGVGNTDIEHALATGTVVARRPASMRVIFNGTLNPYVTAKDMMLHLIAVIGAGGAAGHAIEFCGSAIRALPIEARLTLCNMAVECAAWTGLVAPDQTTLDYLQNRPYAPTGAAWERAVQDWKQLTSDPGAHFPRDV